MDTRIIIGIINECIDLDAIFTFYDVLTEAHERKCKIDARDVEEIVNGFKYPQYYTETELINEGRVVNVIHPSDKFAESYEFPVLDIVKEAPVISPDHDIFEYVAQEDRYKTDPTPKKINVQIEKTLPATGNPDDYRHIEYLLGMFNLQLQTKPLFDNRGRHTVSASDVKKAGLNVGDVVYVVIGMGVVTLSVNVPPLSASNSNNIGVAGTLTVDKYYNIRINVKFLLAAANSLSSTYGGNTGNVNELSSITSDPIENAKIINLYPHAV